MDLIISHTSGEPIYRQIKNQIEDHILSGRLPDGHLLPSIRNLARHLQISVITTKRAYDELEQEGLIASVTGKGTFVSGKNKEALREVRYRQLEEQIQDLVAAARSLDLKASDLTELITMYYGGEPCA